MTRPPLLLAFLLLAGGCTRDAERFPSLAPRAVEKLSFDEPAATAPPVATADSALDAQIATLRGQLGRITTGFDADAAAADRAAVAARGKGVGSEAWLTAQTALAGLDDWRAQASSLVTDVEQLALGRAQALQPSYPALVDLSGRVQAEAGRQSAAIARIEAGLPRA